MSWLLARTVELLKKHGICPPSANDAIIWMPDRRFDDTEYLVHELSHAALLGILQDLDDNWSLSTTISATLGLVDRHESWGQENYSDELNETETFAVEMEVLSQLGIEFDEGAMVAACHDQTGWSCKETREIWQRFRDDPAFEGAVNEVLAVFYGT